jgi:hypothetical protein
VNHREQPDVMGDYLAAGWSIDADGHWSEPELQPGTCQLCGGECHDTWHFDTEPCPEFLAMALDGTAAEPETEGPLAGVVPRLIAHTVTCDRHFHAHLCQPCREKLERSGRYPTPEDFEHRWTRNAVTEHRVVRYRPDPDRSEWDVRAYCTGCRWRWDGIGCFEHAKTEHENLNQKEQP